MFRYCPVCAGPNIQFLEGKCWKCPDCGMIYYHNTAAACGALIEMGDAGILLLRRGKEPAAGKLDLPGGFADPGEGIVEALRRECAEEIGWEPPEESITFLASFANVYPYKDFMYNTCDSFFTVHAPAGFSLSSLKLQESEIAEAAVVRHGCINYDDIAFPSAKKALRYYYDNRH
ncbi:MAG: NUDIX domain-containing protein [Spirochaetaceae bacterium]|nr:NUDIX domain-containing protein [Spirochaetaceae bacterium]